jgi:hypothetical protein
MAQGANAGCGDFLQWRNLQMLNPAPVAKFDRTHFVPASESNSPNGASIVGMWNVTFTSQGNTGHNPPIPDGATIDFGYSQWHSDGLEFLNSGMHVPATQNYCLGIYRKIGFATYQLNHFALSYDATTGDLTAKANIREEVTLDDTGNVYSGTFTITIFDLNGNQVDQIAGTITGNRITVDTTAP